MYRVNESIENKTNNTDKDLGNDIITTGEYKGYNSFYNAALEPNKGKTSYGSTDLSKTYKDNELREAVALVKAKANTRDEALSDPEKKKIYLKYMDKSKISMITKIDDFGNKILGIEDYIPNAQYQTDEHMNAVVEDIINGWDIISQNSKFHAIFATSSIPEAIGYYKLFKSKV